MKFLEKHKTSVILLTIALFVAWLCLAIIFVFTLDDNGDPNEITKSFFIRLGILELICPFWFPFIVYIVIPKKGETYYIEVSESELPYVLALLNRKENK